MRRMIKLRNCVIIGAGPAGMNAALYLKRGGIEPIIIESDVPGGKMLKTYKIENYLGYESIDGGELALKMSKQVKDLGVKIIRDKVIKVSHDDKFVIKCENNEFISDYVIVATGRIPRKLGLKNESELIGRGISYCAVCDGAFYKNKEVAIIGGGNSALTEALYLSDLCLKVYILARKDLRASDVLQNRIKNKDNIVVLKNVEVSEILGNDKLSSILLNNGDRLDVSGMFIAIGGNPELSFLDSLGVELVNGYIKTNNRMESNIKGLYAAGDVRYKDFYQIITAASDGAIAALSIREDV